MIDIFMKWIIKNKEWLFDGIGTSVVEKIFCPHKEIKKIVRIILQRQNEKRGHSKNTAFDTKSCVKYDHSVEKYEKNVQEHNNASANKISRGYFTERFEKMQMLLNDAKDVFEKEYTVEFIGHLIGLQNVEELKKYLVNDIEPEDSFKEKFVETFGVNREWMLYNQGENPFESNMQIFGNNPMDILRKTDLKTVQKFIIVIGDVGGKRYACIVKKQSQYFYALYQKLYVFDTAVGATGTALVIHFYRFLREARKRNLLYETAYMATEKQMLELYQGKIAPKKVFQFDALPYFLDDFLSLEEDAILKHKIYWKAECIMLQRMIRENLEKYDKDFGLKAFEAVK